MPRFSLKQFLRDWTLVIAMAVGVAAYFLFAALGLGASAHRAANTMVSVAQPLLIFAMLFLTFCKVDLRRMRLMRWHLWLLLIQGGLFAAIAVALIMMPHSGMRVVLEGTMICIICPTATAAAVVTRKLGGDINHITTYTVMINLLASLLIPALTPYVHPNPDLSMAAASFQMLKRVFPLLLAPLALAILVKRLAPKLHRWLMGISDLSFYLWAVALALAIAVTTRSIVHTSVTLSTQLWLVGVSLLSCAFQFWAGRRIGALYHDKVTAGQALGQKNTVLAIWLGYTFFTPVTAIVGGFYSIWHNVVNTVQLYRHNKSNPA